MSDSWQPVSALAQAVHALGFQYQPEQDIIVSRIDAWQRTVGFTWAYDVLSPGLQMIIDCEPIYFTYDGKNWMIELWKGQYGLETGAEIGVYNAAPNPPAIQSVSEALRSWFPTLAGIADQAEETVAFFACASPAEQLVMSYTLSKDGKPLFHRGPESHWWLTGFRWGEFTKSTSQLTMAAEIVFTTAQMCAAFEKALRAMGYAGITNKDATTIGFTFGKPKTTQPVTRTTGEASHQALNETLVNQYLQLKRELNMTSNDPNLIEEKLLTSPTAKDAYQQITNFLGLLERGRKTMTTIWQTA